MDNTINAKGLSCPQPVILTLKKINQTKSSEITILVDTNTSKENVIRAGGSKGWKAKELEEIEDGYKIILRKDK